jgi:putative ABC transport system permease protein
MSWIRRFSNVFRQGRLNQEIEEELTTHIEEAIEQGSSPDAARKALGPALRYREQSRDVRILPWLDSLASDVVFGWRQLNRRRVTNAAAILSLGLAIGATTAAFRLVDAVLLRKLPVAEPERLYYPALTNFMNADGQTADYIEFFDYPTFRKYRQIVGDRAELMVIGLSHQEDATFGPDSEPVKLFQQYYSGNVFGVFGLRPAIGRLLAPSDDVVPGGHPVAVISYDLWSRRFGRDPQILGKRFLMRGAQFEVIGVAPKGFNGTEPGFATEVFLPAMMNAKALEDWGWKWFRLWVRPSLGVAPEQVRQMLQAVVTRDNEERVKGLPADTPKERIDALLKQSVLMFPAEAGASYWKKEYRRPLLILSILVGLVLLVACANVGNLLTAQASARAREMALRISIGAGRARLVQLMLVESAMVAIAASLLGALFSWWSAPLVVRMLESPIRPIRLPLALDWRITIFGVLVAVAVTFLFGLAPALRASAVKPVSALKGGEDPHARSRLMQSLVAAQMAFCLVVLLIAGLFVASFQRLSTRPLGFAPQNVLLLQAGAGRQKQTHEIWMQAVDRLRNIPGVESAAFAGFALLTGRRTGTVRMPGGAPDPRSPYLLDVSPRFFETMRIGWIDGRDFRADDVPPKPKTSDSGESQAGVAIVNEAFVRAFLGGRNPVGQTLGLVGPKGSDAPFQIVGYVRDAAYLSVREPFRPTVYFPIEPRESVTLLVRTPAGPALAPILRREVAQAHAGLSAGTVERQSAMAERQMIRERLLSALSLFFAALALALAGIGLYGVMNYSVTQQRKEIGIRMALGARSAQIVRRIALGMLGVVSFGALVGLIGGLVAGRFVQTLLFDVKATDVEMVAAPLLLLLGAGVLATLPSAIRATRIDPSETLRGE